LEERQNYDVGWRCGGREPIERRRKGDGIGHPGVAQIVIRRANGERAGGDDSCANGCGQFRFWRASRTSHGMRHLVAGRRILEIAFDEDAGVRQGLGRFENPPPA
jgi:hypothetical protein